MFRNFINQLKQKFFPPTVRNYPNPITRRRSIHSRGGSRGWGVGEATSRLKPELSTWYKKLTPQQRGYHDTVRKLTNNELTRWNRAGCPGHVNQEAEHVECFMEIDFKLSPEDEADLVLLLGE